MTKYTLVMYIAVILLTTVTFLAGGGWGWAIFNGLLSSLVIGIWEHRDRYSSDRNVK